LHEPGQEHCKQSTSVDFCLCLHLEIASTSIDCLGTQKRWGPKTYVHKLNSVFRFSVKTLWNQPPRNPLHHGRYILSALPISTRGPVWVNRSPRYPWAQRISLFSQDLKLLSDCPRQGSAPPTGMTSTVLSSVSVFMRKEWFNFSVWVLIPYQVWFFGFEKSVRA
jgi:hypothetical protein